MAHLAIYFSVSISQQQQILARVSARKTKMQQWADSAPSNYLHKLYLLEAELDRIRGFYIRAMDFYDRAIAEARKNKYPNEEALANELAARFYLDWGKVKIAQIYINETHCLYSLWGATAKVEDLQVKYSQLLVKSLAIASMADRLRTINTNTRSGEISDLATIIKASQTISSEIVLDKLLAALMKILIENAGAQVGYLVLETQGKLLIEASGAVDRENVTVLKSIPIKGYLPKSIINYVVRTQQTVLKNNAAREGNFTQDPYIKSYQTKSLLAATKYHLDLHDCLPDFAVCYVLGCDRVN